MKIIKRNGTEVMFDISKITMAVSKANEVVDEKVRMTPVQIQRIAESVSVACEEMGRSPSVEEIQDLVEKSIMAHGAFEVAKEYITYRYTRSLARQSNTTDDRILSLIECNNEEVKQENANKNPTINAVQRDYMAGEVSKDITSRILLPKDIVAAHEAGVWVTPAFPKLIYVLEEDNITEGAPYWYLTELAAKCTARRMVPDYISEKVMLQNKVDKNGNGQCYTCMGCRSFLTPYVDENGQPKYYGRFNQGVVTLNLVDVACTANAMHGGETAFFKVLEERLELCHRALQCRHDRLEGTLSDAAPILWQYGALARLSQGEPITKLLHGGYSTLSLGYAGLWECVYAITGKKLTEPEGEAFGLRVMQALNDACAVWKAAENIDYSLYGTPLESTTYKFASCLQRRFGIIPGVTDRNYITNSYHVHVTEPVDAFEKLALEAKFQKLSPGGAISYVEVPDMQNNIEAVLSVMQFIYDNIMYAELNTKSDYCQECGWDGEIEIVEKDGKLIWKCPNCGNTDQNKMNVARRTCGYIGTQFWNQGRTQEIRERVLHL